MKKYVLQSVILLVLWVVIMASQALAVGEVPIKGLEEKNSGPVLETMDLLIEKENIKLKMIFNDEIEYIDFIWENPLRIVIDIKNGTYRNWFTQLAKNDWLFNQVRIFENRFGLRIVVELEMEGPNYQIIWNSAVKTLEVKIPRRFMLISSTELTEGVEYLQIKRGLPEGLVKAQALNVTVSQTAGHKFYSQVGSEFEKPKLLLKTAYRNGSLKGFSKVSDLVHQEGGFAGINGGYFSGNGFPLGLIIRDGQLVSQPLYNRTAWGIDQEGRMRMEAVSLQIEVTINGQVYSLTGLNRLRSADELIVYSRDYGVTTQTNQWGLEIVVTDGKVTGIQTNDSAIPEHGWVISGHGKYKALLESLQIGDTVEVSVKLIPDWLTQRVQYALGGGPRLIKDGEIFITGLEEQFKSDILIGRAPRTALGITLDQHLLMVVVDGRVEKSIGMNLQELAELLLDLGAVDAMNLDGGKSSTFVIGDEVLNAPSGGKEIPVHNGLILLVQSVGESEK